METQGLGLEDLVMAGLVDGAGPGLMCSNAYVSEFLSL